MDLTSRVALTTLALLGLACLAARLLMAIRKGRVGATVMVAALFGFSAVVDPPQQHTIQNSNDRLRRENSDGDDHDPV
jgi:hypothetical protein